MNPVVICTVAWAGTNPVDRLRLHQALGVTAADAWNVPIADGRVDVPNLAVHERLGIDFDF